MSGSSELGLRIFERPEHEFLRIAAMVEPDWDELCNLGEVTDWVYLRKTALAHQLDGVIAWRLLDTRLDGVVSGELREDCQSHLDWLEDYNRPWWDQVGSFCTLLDQRDIDHVIYGGPVQYTPLGIAHFPRCWDDIELDVRINSEMQMDELAAAAKAERYRWWPRWSTLTLPGGFKIELGANLPSPTNDAKLASWDIWSKPRSEAMTLGRSQFVPHPSMLLLRWAGFQTWQAVHNAAGPLSLWALARIAAWVHHKDWSWDEFGQLLRDSTALFDAAFVDGRSEASWPDRSIHEGQAPAMCALWVFDIADRIYHIYPDGVTGADLITPLPRRTLKPATLGGRFDVPEKKTHVVQLIHWNWPGDESVLFNPIMQEGFEARIHAGVWQIDDTVTPRTVSLASDGQREYEDFTEVT